MWVYMAKALSYYVLTRVLVLARKQASPMVQQMITTYVKRGLLFDLRKDGRSGVATSTKPVDFVR